MSVHPIMLHAWQFNWYSTEGGVWAVVPDTNMQDSYVVLP